MVQCFDDQKLKKKIQLKKCIGAFSLQKRTSSTSKNDFFLPSSILWVIFALLDPQHLIPETTRFSKELSLYVKGGGDATLITNL
jgi:hypothetical protein